MASDPAAWYPRRHGVAWRGLKKRDGRGFDNNQSQRVKVRQPGSRVRDVRFPLQPDARLRLRNALAGLASEQSRKKPPRRNFAIHIDCALQLLAGNDLILSKCLTVPSERGGTP